MTLTAAILAVGDELLLGDLVNTNAAWLGERLAASGVQVVASAMVGDDIARLARALRSGLRDADVVVLTGGLGPTSDDVTRDAVALVCAAPLVRSAALEQQLRDRFASYGYAMPAQVLVQADVPGGARVLDNPLGTAPGLVLTVGDKLVVAVPGPPHEMRATVQPVLAELAARSGTVVVTRTLHCAGTGESDVAQRVESAVQVPAGVALAYLAGSGIVRVRFTGTTAAQLDPLVEAAAAALGQDVFGRDDATLPGVVSGLLRQAGATVGTAESLTGGLLASALVDLPGSSEVFRGGLLVYATDLKASLAGVDPEVLTEHGPVSPQTAPGPRAGRPRPDRGVVRPGDDRGGRTAGAGRSSGRHRARRRRGAGRRAGPHEPAAGGPPAGPAARSRPDARPVAPKASWRSGRGRAVTGRARWATPFTPVADPTCRAPAARVRCSARIEEEVGRDGSASYAAR